MPNENQEANEPSLEGIVPDQGTPQETPPETDAPDEQKTEVEKPAESDSTSAPADAAPPEKTPEQLKADRAFFQEDAQKTKAELARLREQGQQPSEQPVTATEFQAKQPSAPDWISNLGNLSDEELNDKLREDPLLQMQVQEYRQEQRLTKMLDQRDAATKADALLEHESRQTQKALDVFRDKHNVPQEQYDEVLQELKTLGLKGRPPAIGELIMDRLTARQMSGNLQVVATEAAAKAAQAQKTQVLTMQPDGGGPQPDATPKTQEEKIAGTFTPSRENTVLQGLFSK